MAAYQLPWLPERALGRRGGQAFRDILVRTGLDPASADRYAGRARDPALLRGPLNWYRAMPFSLREPAGPVQVPTMFVWGNRDPFVSRTAAELCGRYVAGPYRGTELDGASHWLPEQAADQVAALLAEHLAGGLRFSGGSARWPPRTRICDLRRNRSPSAAWAGSATESAA
jgi:pimeloyl-ACP methyl ester carboxylesterase